MNIAICDDMHEYRDKIQALIKPYVTQFALKVFLFSSGEELQASLTSGHNYAVIFLDIEMNEISGIDVARTLREQHNNSIIIFITSHVNYVSDTFRLDAFQFLLKPIDENAFRVDFERAMRTYKERHKQYLIKWRDGNQVLEYNEIYYIESYNRHLFIHTASGGYECIGKLADEYDKLKPFGFVRCHQGYLVRLDKIRQIGKDTVLLKNNETIPVSRQFRPELLRDFNLFLAGTKI